MIDWIPVEKELPPPYVPVLITVDFEASDKKQYVATTIGVNTGGQTRWVDMFSNNLIDTVIAWSYRPQPYNSVPVEGQADTWRRKSNG